MDSRIKSGGDDEEGCGPGVTSSEVGGDEWGHHPVVTPAKAGVQLLRDEKQSRPGFRLSPG